MLIMLSRLGFRWLSSVTVLVTPEWSEDRVRLKHRHDDEVTDGPVSGGVR